MIFNFDLEFLKGQNLHPNLSNYQWQGKYSVSLNFNPKSNNLETTAGFVKGIDQ
jgi:hypothetical protein